MPAKAIIHFYNGVMPAKAGIHFYNGVMPAKAGIHFVLKELLTFPTQFPFQIKLRRTRNAAAR